MPKKNPPPIDRDDPGDHRFTHAAVRDRLVDVKRARQLRNRQPFDDVVARVRGTEAPAQLTTSLATDVLAAAVEWFKKNAVKALLFGAAGAAIGWLINVYVMAKTYDGFYVPSGAATTGKGNAVWGSMIWLLGSTIVGTVVSYRLAVGSEQFWKEVRGFPSTMRAVVRDDGDRALVHGLWGFAGAMLFVLILAPSFSGLMAVGVLVLLGSTLRPLVTGITLAVWRAVGKRFFPERPVQPGVSSLVVASLGSAGALAMGFLIAEPSTRFAVGALAAGAAYLITKKAAADPPPPAAAPPPPTPPSPASTAMLLAVAGLGAATMVVYLVATAGPAAADDGGWAECGSSLQSWIGCGGSLQVWLQGMLGGTFSGLGGIFGSMFGGGAGSGDGDQKFADMSDADKRRYLQDYLMNKYPGITPEQAAEAARQIVDGESAYGGDLSAVFDELEKQAEAGLDKLRAELAFLTSPEFIKAFGEEYWKDLSSGAQIDRIIKTMEAMSNAPEGLLKDAWAAGGALWENKEALMASGMEWLATASNEEILAAMANAPVKITDAVLNDYKGKLSELYEASLAGDDAKVADIIGTLAGEAQFEALLGAGMLKGMDAGGDFLSGMKKGGGPDVDAPGGPKKPGDGPDGDGTGTPPRPDWLDEDIYNRPNGPLSPAEIKSRYEQLPPGERLRLTPEEAAKWGGYEEQMLITQRENSLLYGKGTDAKDKPWVELKQGNEDALRLREEGYYEDLERYDYNPKPNHIKSKSLLAEEMRYVPEGLDYKPGEVVAFKPDPMPRPDEVSPAVYKQLQDRSAEWDAMQAGQKPTSTSGPIIDRYGNQIVGEAQLQPDGRWISRMEVPDANGRRPYDPGYQQTWSDWSRTAGDNDTFAIGGGGDLVPGVRGTDVQTTAYYGPDGRPLEGWEMTEAERLTYAASGGNVPGEGNTPIRYPDDPNFDQKVYDSTIEKAEREGVLLIDADGYYVTRPGAYY